MIQPQWGCIKSGRVGSNKFLSPYTDYSNYMYMCKRSGANAHSALYSSSMLSLLSLPPPAPPRARTRVSKALAACLYM